MVFPTPLLFTWKTGPLFSSKVHHQFWCSSGAQMNILIRRSSCGRFMATDCSEKHPSRWSKSHCSSSNWQLCMINYQHVHDSHKLSGENPNFHCVSKDDRTKIPQKNRSSENPDGHGQVLGLGRDAKTMRSKQQKDLYMNCMSGWWFQPIWTILVNWDDEIPNIWKNKNVPSHQPVIV